MIRLEEVNARNLDDARWLSIEDAQYERNAYFIVNEEEGTSRDVILMGLAYWQSWSGSGGNDIKIV